jgi:hypothetical protein
MSEATYKCKDCGESFLWKDFGNDGYCKKCDIYTVDSSHTDPTEIKTALALAEKKLARAEKELAKHQWVSVEDRFPEDKIEEYLVLYSNGTNSCVNFIAGEFQWNADYKKNPKQITHWKPIIALENVLMPDKGGDK